MNNRIIPNDVVFSGPDGALKTTSLKVAEVFNKRHSHVLRDIEALIEGERRVRSEHQPKFGLMFTSQHFSQFLYELQVGNGAIRQEPAYEMTEEGFALLVMGYSGDRALLYKLLIMEQFVSMRDTLNQLKAQYDDHDRPVLIGHATHRLGVVLPIWMYRNVPHISVDDVNRRWSSNYSTKKLPVGSFISDLVRFDVLFNRVARYGDSSESRILDLQDVHRQILNLLPEHHPWRKALDNHNERSTHLVLERMAKTLEHPRPLREIIDV